MGLLVVASEFPPFISPVGDYLYQMAISLSAREDLTVIAPKRRGAKEFDKEAGLKTIRSGSKKMKASRVIAFHRAAAKQIVMNRPDHIIASTWDLSGSVGLNVAKKAGVPYSVILFDYEVKRCFANRPLLNRLKAVLDAAENIFLVSEYTAGLIERLEIPEEKKRVIYAGGDKQEEVSKEAISKCKKELKIGDNEKIIFSSGALEEEYAYDILIWSAFFLHQKNKDFKLIISGEGSQREKLKRTIKDVKLNENVIIIPPGKYDSALLNCCHLYAALGRGKKHRKERALDLYLLRASYLAKPVVVSQCGGLHEFILDNKTGFIVPPLSPKDTARKLTELLSSPEKAKKFGAAGRKFIDNKYTWDQTAKKITNKIRKAKQKRSRK